MIKTEVCPSCAGKKKVERNMYGLPPNEAVVVSTIEVSCEMCHGSGTLPIIELCFTCNGKKKFPFKCRHYAFCPTCEGDGYVERGALNKGGGLLNRVHEDSIPHKEYYKRKCASCADTSSDDSFWHGWD